MADAEHRVVPIAVDNNMGTVVGIGERATPDMAVNTTRIVRRDFESWAYSLRRVFGVKISASL